MVQGYFMGAGSSSYLQGTWKKIKKTYVPYLEWAVAYGVFYWITIGKSFTLMDILLGKTALHMYYMFHYMVFAIFCPLLYFLPRTARIIFLYFMLLSNIGITLALEISKTYHVQLITYSGPNPLKWWGFIAIGMLLAEYPRVKDYIAQHARAFAVGAIAVFLIGLIEPFLNHTVGYLFNKVALFPLSVGLTLALAIYYSTPMPLGEKFLSYIGERTFGIYLGHFFLVDPLRNFLVHDRALTAVIVLFTCLAAREIKDLGLQKLNSSSVQQTT
jgi:surface polysaccharide O-acyltransferase-like enzyme